MRREGARSHPYYSSSVESMRRGWRLFGLVSLLKRSACVDRCLKTIDIFTRRAIVQDVTHTQQQQEQGMANANGRTMVAIRADLVDDVKVFAIRNGVKFQDVVKAAFESYIKKDLVQFVSDPDRKARNERNASVFFSTRCTFHPGAKVSKEILQYYYHDWCNRNRIESMLKEEFPDFVRSLGVKDTTIVRDGEMKGAWIGVRMGSQEKPKDDQATSVQEVKF